MYERSTFGRACALALALATAAPAATLTSDEKRFVAAYKEAVATAKRGQPAAAFDAFRRLAAALPEQSPRLQAKVRPRLDRALARLAPAPGAPPLPKQAPARPPTPEVPELIVGTWREPTTHSIQVGTSAMLVVHEPPSPTPEPEGPPPEVLESFAREAEARRDFVVAFRHRLRRYILAPDEEAARALARVGEAFAAVSRGHAHRMRNFMTTLIEHEPAIPSCLRELARRPPDEVEPVLEISEAWVEGQPKPQVFTYAELVGYAAAPPADRPPFALGRPEFFTDVHARELREVASEVLQLRDGSGPEPAFHRAVEVVRALRGSRHQSGLRALPVLVWPDEVRAPVGQLDYAMPPIPFDHPRQGSAALKAWLQRDRAGTLEGLKTHRGSPRWRAGRPRSRLRALRPPRPRRRQAMKASIGSLAGNVILASVTGTIPGQEWTDSLKAEQETQLPELERTTLEERIQTAEYDDPQIMQELLETVQFSSPIVLDLPGGDGELSVTGRNDMAAAVPFDIDGTGEPALVQWLLPNGDAWLAEDVDGDGVISSGHELFGTADGHVNGWLKLAERDLDGDGQIAGEELAGLLVWQERVADGISAADELTTAEDAGLTAIALPTHGLESKARFGEEVRPAWDLFPTTWSQQALP